MKLGKVAQEVRDLYEPTQKESLPYVGLEHISQGDLSFVGQGISTDTFSTKKAFKKEDILFGTLRPYFRKVVRPNFNGVCSTDITVLRAKKGHSQSFLFYLIASQPLIDYASVTANGTKMPRAKWKVLAKTDWNIPELSEQEKIASILSAYDDLIENNNKRIIILEQMAEQIYKEWFVRMRYPGYEDNKSEKGIPVGWNVVPIGSLFSFYIGGGWGADQSSALFSETAFVIRGTDIPSASHGIPNIEVLRYHKPSNLKPRKLKPLDIVFEVSGGSKDQWLGRNFLITKELLESYGGSVMCASFCKLIRPDVSKVSPYFLDQFLKLYYSTGLVSTFQVQSTGISNYQFEGFMKYQSIILPDGNLQNKFSKIMEPIYSEINLLGRQLVILKQTRDLLLPRLISGKLRVKNLKEPLTAKA